MKRGQEFRPLEVGLLVRNLLEQCDDVMTARANRETVERQEELRLQAVQSEVLHLSLLNFYL